jgi:hypothetical protein
MRSLALGLLLNVVKVMLGSFLISVPSIVLPLGWGFRSSVAQAQTIQYQLDEELNFKSELKPITSNEFCDLDSTISNFQLGQLQGDFQKWPEVEDFLIDRMSKDLKKILEQIEQSSVYSFLNQFTDMQGRGNQATGGAKIGFLGINHEEFKLFE